MIQEFFNGMVAILLAKFILNDVPHAAGLLGSSSKVFYHVTPRENLARIMLEGLYEPVHMLTSVIRAREWQEEVEEYEPAVVLKVMLPAEWQLKEDLLHPKGMAVVSEKHIPAKYISFNDVPHAAGMLSGESLPSHLPGWAREDLLHLGVGKPRPVKELMGENFPFEVRDGYIITYHITKSTLVPIILKEGLHPVKPTAISAVYLAWDAEQAGWLLPPTIFEELAEGERLETLIVRLPLNWPVLPDPEETDVDEASGKLNIPVIMSLLPIPPKYIERTK